MCKHEETLNANKDYNCQWSLLYKLHCCQNRICDIIFKPY